MEEIQQEKKNRTKRSKEEILLILLGVGFVGIMLVLPLCYVFGQALSLGIETYMEAIQTEYVASALRVTFIATFLAVLVNTAFGLSASWVLTRYQFKGKQVLATLIDIPFSISPVIAGLAFLMTFGRLGWAGRILRAIRMATGLDIRIAFAIPGVVLATIFVTFPFISREILPVLNAQGCEEEEAAALMGASKATIFFKITLPKMRWALLYGIILCTARALGEFGAVNAISKTRGVTFTLPLEIDALYLSGSKESIVSAFAVSTILVIFAIAILILRDLLEYRQKSSKNRTR